MIKNHREDCCIGDVVRCSGTSEVYQTVYQPLPSQLQTWGRSSSTMKFRRHPEGLIRYE